MVLYESAKKLMKTLPDGVVMVEIPSSVVIDSDDISWGPPTDWSNIAVVVISNEESEQK